MGHPAPPSRRPTTSPEVPAAAGPADLEGWDPAEQLGEPGEYPFTRGPYPTMYRGRLWTMRQYAGFGTAEATNRRFLDLLAAGQTGLSVAFDLPTQMGLDSDDHLATGEVGKVGVAIDSLEDMRALFDGVPLGEVSTSMTINAPAAILLLLYQLVAEEQGVSAELIRGTVQNDILKEYAARGTYIYPPAESMRLVTDTFAFCRDELPNWNPISISGYHIREAGATASQEVGLTLANGLAYVRSAQDAGLEVDEFASRLSFFWNAHSDFLEEVAKFRAARRLWARLMRERVGAAKPESWRMRFHTQTAGSTLTAQQPENNIVRTALQALAAVLGGTQSLHTNAFDEALGIPTARSARVALRTQQIIAHEAGAEAAIDPLGGSYYVESLTDALEAQATAIIDEVEALGGAVAATESGFVQRQIEDSAYEAARRIESSEKVIVGVNRFVDDSATSPPVMSVDSELEAEQVRRLGDLRQRRDGAEVTASLAEVERSAREGDNLLYPMKSALRALATVGEVSNVLRGVFGRYRPGT